MKKLWYTVCMVAMIAICNNSSAQILDKIKNKAKARADQKVDQTIDKGLDEAEGKNKKAKTGDDKEEDKTSDVAKSNSQSNPQTLKSYSKYDFVPGDKIVYAEDFGQDAVGEFPLKWNTNGTGEVVTIEGLPGKWLQITGGTKYESPYSNNLPENYTVEFDLVLEFKASMHVPNIEFLIVNNKVKTTYLPGMRLMLAPQAGTYSSDQEQNSIDRIRFVSYNEKGERYLEGKDQLIGEFYKYNHKSIPVHVAIWVQKERARVWINQTKVYDLPKAIPAGSVLTNVALETEYYGSSNENYKYFISNFKIAVAPPDTRNKLITEGSWSTTGILFDVNADKIKPASYGTLKEIATILSENADVRVKIIGHTDSDGDDAKNLELSKKRAAAVKSALNKEFNIDESRMEIDGMGETKPDTDNKTPEAKAQNRSVKFVKM